MTDFENSDILILVVDDEPKNIQLIGKILSDNHFDVAVASDGQKAFQRIDEDFLPDLILLDVNMPVWDGYTTCGYLKSRALTQHIPVIFLTANSDQDAIVKGFNVGAADYVVKPFKQAELLARINTQLRLQQALKRLEKLRENAETANKKKSRFLAMMSHEIRTPMNAILGFTQLLLVKQDLNEEQQQGLEIIGRSAENLLGLINDVLDINKIEIGEIELNPVECDLRTMLHDLANLFRIRIEVKGLQLIVDVDESVPVLLWMDEKKFRQICINLLGNSLKFTEQGSITVRVMSSTIDKSHYRLLLEVEDTGVGIAKEEIDKVFASFEQTSSGVKSGEGTGLGMVISRQIARKMGGDITFKSELELGSCFRVDVLVEVSRTANVVQSIPSQRVAKLNPGETQHRILIVDDIESHRLFMRKILVKEGFDVSEADSGLEGIERFELWQPDLVLMDIKMPGIDGLETTRRIRAMATNKPLYIVAVSASVMAAESQRVLDAGADAFIGKPFKLEALYDVVARLLGLDLGCEVIGTQSCHYSEVLVADDTPVNRQLIQRQLELLGLTVTVAVDGEDALQKWRAGDFPLLLTDCAMPEMDGFALTRLIRQEEVERDQRTTIVAYTANPEENRIACEQVGMDGVIGKPLDMNALEQWLNHRANNPPDFRVITR